MKLNLWNSNKKFIEDLKLLNLVDSDEEAINICVAYTREIIFKDNKKTDKQF